MNKREIIKQLIKDDTIKSLYTSDNDRKFLNELVVEQLGAVEKQIADAKKRLRIARRDWKDSKITLMKYEEIRAEVNDLIKSAGENPPPVQQPKEPKQIIKKDTEIPEYQFDVVTKLNQIMVQNPVSLELLAQLDMQQQQNFINLAIEKVNPEEPKQSIDAINKEVLYTYLDLARKQPPQKTSFPLSFPIVQQTEPEPAVDVEVTVLTNQEKEEIKEIIIDVTEDDNNEPALLALTNKDVPKEKKREIVKDLTSQAKGKISPETQEKIKDTDISNAIVTLAAKAPKKESEFIARESFDKAYIELGQAFDEYEEIFTTTPYLSEQSKVLFQLEDALKGFEEKLKLASIGTDAGKIRPEDLQETKAVDEKTKKFIFDKHESMVVVLKELISIVKKLNNDNLTTVMGSNIRKQARLKAKELMKELAIVRNALGSLSAEDEERITFKENLNEQEMTPSDYVKAAHKQIVSNMTKLDRIARSEKEKPKDQRNNYAINKQKFITTPVKETLKYIDDISQYFPVKAPFGKSGGIEEIKKQVNGIGRDIVDIISKIKKVVNTGKSTPQNIEILDKLIKKSMTLIEKYFDLDIDDPEIRKLIPKKPNKYAVAFNDGASTLKKQLRQIVKKYGPRAKKLYTNAVNKEEAYKSISKFFKKVIGNRIKTPLTQEEFIKSILGLDK